MPQVTWSAARHKAATISAAFAMANLFARYFMVPRSVTSSEDGLSFTGWHHYAARPGLAVAVAALGIAGGPIRARRASPRVLLERTLVAGSLVPGLLVSILCALALPLPPFGQDAWKVLDFGLPIAAWFFGARVVSRRSLRSRQRSYRSRLIVLAAIGTAVFCFAAFRSAKRRSPGEFWEGLPIVGGQVPKSMNDLERDPASGALRLRGGDECRDLLSNEHLPCRYLVGDRRCISLEPDVDVNFITSGTTTCPRVEVRREPETGRLFLSRSKGEGHWGWGPEQGYLLEKGVQGRMLNALAIGQSLRVPTEWMLLALAGLLFAVWAAGRRRVDSEGPTLPGAPYRTSQLVFSEDSATQNEALLWWAMFVALSACCAPMMLAIALGVGR